MKDPLWVIAAIAGLAIAYVMLPVFIHVFSRYRSKREIDCPRRKVRACVTVDARRAALSALVSPVPKVRITSCDLWRDEMFCSQECRWSIVESQFK